MRILGVTETCDLAALYLRLVEAGHEVRVAIDYPEARGTLSGMVPRVPDWRAELDWLKRGDDGPGVIVFEAASAGFGEQQDELRRQGYRVVGGSAFGDRLENDRAFGQAALADIGMPTARIWEFTDALAADAFIAANPARYVLKFSGHGHASHDNYVGQREDGADVRAMLNAGAAKSAANALRFILMEHLTGVEVGVGAFFDGDRFILPACLDWEHKRFFPGDLGELTGEMGTVATFERSGTLFGKSLAKVAPLLRGKGHVGWVNLNMIVNARGIWPLEFTCRFGYPGFAVLEPLQDIEWGALLQGLVEGTLDSLPVGHGFSVGVVLCVPPFPYTRLEVPEPVGLPIFLPEPPEPNDGPHIHLGEAGMDGERLVTSGIYGWTMVVTGVGVTIADAQADAYQRARRIVIPNMRYRLDVGERLRGGDYAALESWGLLGDA